MDESRLRILEPAPIGAWDLRHAALVGLCAGVAAAPALGALELPLLAFGTGGMGPVTPALVARGACVAAGVGVAALVLPRLWAEPIARDAIRASVAVRLAVLLGIAGGAAGGAAGMLLSRALFDSGPRFEGLGAALVGLPIACIGGLAGGRAVGGRGGPRRTAWIGMGLGICAWLIGYLVALVIGVFVPDRGGTASGSPVLQSAFLAGALLLFPALVRTGDAFDAPPAQLPG